MYKGLLILFLGILLVGCNSEPSDDDIKSCIMNINGIDEIGAEYSVKQYGIPVPYIINDISIKNIIENEYGYEVQIVYNFSIGHVPCKPGELKDKAEVLQIFAQQGFDFDPDTCLKTATTKMFSYQFNHGTKGWSCKGQPLM